MDRPIESGPRGSDGAEGSLKSGKLPSQVLQLGTVIVIAGVGLFTARQHFVPKSFGELGHYRADAVELIASLPAKYSGWQRCNECHDDVVATKNASFHRGLSCETCHGPALAHALEETDETPPLPTRRNLCLSCHRYLPSRPTGFPQIVEQRHEPAKLCHTCHDPHDPTPPERPGACSACHATIARVKAVSHHEPLDCQICHETPPEHMVLPRSNLPRKPFEREFCGTCHAEGATPPKKIRGIPIDLSQHEIPRIDLETHGGTLLCWQCHYQHSPEAR